MCLAAFLVFFGVFYFGVSDSRHLPWSSFTYATSSRECWFLWVGVHALPPAAYALCLQNRGARIRAADCVRSSGMLHGRDIGEVCALTLSRCSWFFQFSLVCLFLVLGSACVASTCNTRLVLCVSHRSHIRFANSHRRLHPLDFLWCLLCAAGCSAVREMVCCSGRSTSYANRDRIVCTHPDDPQCAALARPGTNVRPPLRTPGRYPMDPLPLWSLAVCRNAFGTPAHFFCRKLGF